MERPRKPHVGRQGRDLVAWLAQALGITATDLMPSSDPPDTLAVLQGQACTLFDGLLQTADRETLLILNPLLQLTGRAN